MNILPDGTVTTEVVGNADRPSRTDPGPKALPPAAALQKIRLLALELRARTDLPALSLGCLELIVEAAEQATLVTMASEPRYEDNTPLARTIGACLVLLRDPTAVKPRQVAVDDGLLRGHILRILDRYSRLPKGKTEPTNRVVHQVTDAIAELAGLSSDESTTREAIKAWSGKRSWLPRGALVKATTNLLRPLGLIASGDALRKTYERYVRARPRPKPRTTVVPRS